MSGIPIAAHDAMDARVHLATEFYGATHAEMIPFVSDEANWYDFDYLDSEELASVLESHYGLRVDEATLGLPFWKFLDFLAENRS